MIATAAADTTTHEPADWLQPVRQGEAQGWCIVTDSEVLGPYAAWEETQEALEVRGVTGDVFPMRYA